MASISRSMRVTEELMKFTASGTSALMIELDLLSLARVQAGKMFLQHGVKVLHEHGQLAENPLMLTSGARRSWDTM